MEMKALRRLSSVMPRSVQEELRRAYFAVRVRSGRFTPDEPDSAVVPALVSPGDVVLDVGANVGHYTALFSRVVGPIGRVIALEPVPDTFRVLASNTRLFGTTASRS